MTKVHLGDNFQNWSQLRDDHPNPDQSTEAAPKTFSRPFESQPLPSPVFQHHKLDALDLDLCVHGAAGTWARPARGAPVLRSLAVLLDQEQFCT